MPPSVAAALLEVIIHGEAVEGGRVGEDVGEVVLDMAAGADILAHGHQSGEVSDILFGNFVSEGQKAVKISSSTKNKMPFRLPNSFRLNFLL